ncbi:MAG TPA: hypothetical protein VKA60_15315 [Blastocatellia bacterium]|nr:hypothetical protein [Blastocatellia bacterium]
MRNLQRMTMQRNGSSRYRRFCLVAVASFIGCAALVGAAIWPLKLIPVGQAGQNPVKQQFDAKQVKDQIRRGLGRQVRFAAAGDSLEKVSQSVSQVDKFIYERSGLKMSQQTRERLTAMESRTLKGEGRRVGLDDLTDTLTDVAVERMATLTDQEIEESRRVLAADGPLRMRANQVSGIAPDQFVAQVKALRNGAQRQSQQVRDGAHDFIAAEVKSRADLLGNALPEEFGRAPKEGLTPLQAVVFTYSVAADDPLAFSPDELQESVNQKSQAKGKAIAKGVKADKAFGSKGRIFPTPLHVVFNPKTFNGFLDRLEKGGAK